MIQFESALERDCISYFVAQQGLVRITSQPTTITFYSDGSRRYTPDFLVELENVPAILGRLGFGLQTYVEVKYAQQALAEHDLISALFGRLVRENSVLGLRL